MAAMIVGSDKPREVGKMYTGTYYNDGVFYPDQPLLVLREATREEWQAGRSLHGLSYDR
jgi:hypothetical protein